VSAHQSLSQAAALSMVRQRLLRWRLYRGLRRTGELARRLSQTSARDRFEGPAGETSAELDHIAHTLFDWSERIREIRNAEGRHA
jgi:hypothetical protein